MQFDLLSEKEKNRISKHFFERYAVSKDFFDDFVFFRNKHFAWLSNLEAKKFLKEKLNYYSIGFLFLMDLKTFKPTTSAIRFLGSQIKRNVLMLEEGQTKNFFAGKKFSIFPEQASSLDSTGYIALRNGHYFLGSAYFDKKLLMIYPNVSRTDYDKIEADYFLKK